MFVGAGEVAGEERWRVRHGSGQRFRQDLSCLFLKVEEGHARAVVGKSPHERLADTAGAAADQHDAVPEALVFRETHAISRPCFFVYGVSLQFMFLFNAASVL